MSYKKRFIRNDFATSRNFQKNKKPPFKIGEKIRNVTSKKEILKKTHFFQIIGNECSNHIILIKHG